MDQNCWEAASAGAKIISGGARNMSTFDKMRKFEHEFAENMAEGFWTPKDPLSDEEQDRLEHLRQELSSLQDSPHPESLEA